MNEIFKIEHIDPLGQGVSRQDGKILFVSKTLPDEIGQAKVLRQAKGVSFAVLERTEDLQKASPLRQTPDCPHFQQCSGCHFLHTNYLYEIECKKKSFEHQTRILSKHDYRLPVVQVHPANHRLGYRNRIQLHYDLRQRKMGFIDPIHNNIITVDQCQIALPAIREKLRQLYHSHQWEQLLVNHKTKGHIEIAQLEDGQLQLSVNQAYSHGGFQQVNQIENEKLLTLIAQKAKQTGDGAIIDLFGGKGNLSKRLAPRNTLVIDSSNYTQADMQAHQSYFKQDLYGDHVLQQLEKAVVARCGQSIDLLLIDPPRSGFKELAEFAKRCSPKWIFYVSCNLSSQIRDLAPLGRDYEIQEMHLFDFFPSTYHFETLMILCKK